MDIGMIYPYIDTVGGGTIYFMECLKRWNKKHDVTVYTAFINKKLYENYDIDDYNIEIMDIHLPLRSMVDSLSILFQQKLVTRHIGKHEIYNSHIFPCHSLKLDNNIWTPQEPYRTLYDLSPLFDLNILNDKSNLKNPDKAYLRNHKVSLSKKLLYNTAAPFLRYYDKRSYKASKTIANSKYTKQYLSEVYSIDDIDVVYPGVDFDKYNKETLDIDENTILVASRLHYEKHIDLAIKSLVYLDKKFKLKIIGTGPEENNLRKLANELNLNDRVEFLGFVSDDELIYNYKKSFCVIFTPYKEAFGMVCLEAMAAGSPVIGAINSGGYTELIKDYYNGFLVNYNAQEIAEKIKYLDTHPEEYEVMIKNCKKTAKEHTWDVNAEQTMNIFKKQLNKA